MLKKSAGSLKILKTRMTAIEPVNDGLMDNEVEQY